jgi:hypothetical protein
MLPARGHRRGAAGHKYTRTGPASGGWGPAPAAPRGVRNAHGTGTSGTKVPGIRKVAVINFQGTWWGEGDAMIATDGEEWPPLCLGLAPKPASTRQGDCSRTPSPCAAPPPARGERRSNVSATASTWWTPCDSPGASESPWSTATATTPPTTGPPPPTGPRRCRAGPLACRRRSSAWPSA